MSQRKLNKYCNINVEHNYILNYIEDTHSGSGSRIYFDHKIIVKKLTASNMNVWHVYEWSKLTPFSLYRFLLKKRVPRAQHCHCFVHMKEVRKDHLLVKMNVCWKIYNSLKEAKKTFKYWEIPFLWRQVIIWVCTIHFVVVVIVWYYWNANYAYEPSMSSHNNERKKKEKQGRNNRAVSRKYHWECDRIQLSKNRKNRKKNDHP